MSRKLFLALLSICISNSLGSEKQLVKDLFEDYDKRIRPVKNASAITTVGIQIQILRLLEVNGKEEYIKLTMFFKQEWKDEYLVWDPKKYDGIEYVRLPANMVWLPDVVIVTTCDEAEDYIPRDDVLIGLSHKGEIDYAYAFVHYNACPMNSQKFPFDSQKCIMKFTSWKHPMDRMQIVHASPNNTTPRNPNNEWEILPTTNITKDWHRELSNDVYRQVWFTIEIKRKSTYYVWVIIVPTFVISMLSIAGIFAPLNNTDERGEKVTLGLTTLLTLSVILSLVTGEMPKAENLPVLGIFVFLEIVICTSSMAVSVIILFLHQRACVRGWLPPNIMKTQIEKVANRKKIYHNEYCNSPQGEAWNEKSNYNHSIYNTELGKSMAQVTAAMVPLNDCLEKFEEDKNRKELWAALFDRIDIVFFVVFQILNVIALIHIYIGSF